jgi:hypothetical protein
MRGFSHSNTVRVEAPECPGVFLTYTEENKIFISGGKAGTETAAVLAGIADLCSYALELGGTPDVLVTLLTGHTHERTNVDRYEAWSLCDAVGRAIRLATNAERIEHE